MSQIKLASKIARPIDLEQAAHTSYSQDRLLKKAFRFISTDTYPIYRNTDPADLATKTLLVRYALWLVWAVSWPLRMILRLGIIVFRGVSPWYKVNQLREHLNGLGFTKDAYDELLALSGSTNWREQHLASWNLALWHSNQYTKQDAKKCLEFLVPVFQYEVEPHKIMRGLILQAEAAKQLGMSTEAATELTAFISRTKDSQDETPNAYLALASLAKTKAERLKYINQALKPSKIAPLKLQSSKGHPYDLLTVNEYKKPFLPLKKQPLVSVVIPAYNAADTIHTAIEAMMNQSWQNLEILVANDSSTDKTAEIVRKFAKKDPRIKLLSTPTNSGPYVARNLALLEVKGEFITCNDSDDWSHPEKIERQVQHLMENPDVVANASELARAYNDLGFYRRGLPGMYIQVNMSSLMFRRRLVMEKLGFWDSVRFGADSEFIKRLKRIFGDQSVVFMKNSLYSFLRQSDGSLTGSKKFGYHGFLMGARREYAQAQDYHHKSANSLFYPFPVEDSRRPFGVPYPMLPERSKQDKRRSIEVVVAADFRAYGSSIKQALRLIDSYVATGDKVGLVQINTYQQHSNQPLHDKVRSKIDGHNIQSLVYGEMIAAKKLIVFDAASLSHRQTYLPDIEAEQGLVSVSGEVEPFKTDLQKHFVAKQWQPLNPQTQ